MRVVMSREVLISAHSVAVATSRDDVAPVITQLAFERQGDQLAVLATDRYWAVMARYDSIEFFDWDDGAQVLVDPKLMKPVVDILKKDRSGAVATLARDGESAVWLDGNGTSAKVSVDTIRASFPRVATLFPDKDSCGGTPSLVLNVEILAKLSKIISPESAKRKMDGNRWKFFFQTEEQINRPKAVLAVPSEDSCDIQCIIQPVIMRERK